MKMEKKTCREKGGKAKKELEREKVRQTGRENKDVYAYIET